MELVYEPNPKHKEPWQRGRKGTLCPHTTLLNPSAMLKKSILAHKKRYAIFEGTAFAAQCHKVDQATATEYWHGYPEAWMNIPPFLIKQWIEEGRLTKKDIRRAWSQDDLEDML